MLVKRHERVMLSKKKDAKNCKFADYSLSYDDIMHTAQVFISGKNLNRKEKILLPRRLCHKNQSLCFPKI